MPEIHRLAYFFVSDRWPEVREVTCALYATLQLLLQGRTSYGSAYHEGPGRQPMRFVEASLSRRVDSQRSLLKDSDEDLHDIPAFHIKLQECVFSLLEEQASVQVHQALGFLQTFGSKCCSKTVFACIWIQVRLGG